MTCTTRFLSFILLHHFLFMTLTNAQSPFYMYSYCQNSTEKTVNTSYQSNVNNFLSWTTSDSAKGTVSNHNTIGSNNSNYNDTVYGFYDCLGPNTRSFCQFCINTAFREIAKYCPNSVSAIIWYDVCIMGYTNQNPSGRVFLEPSWNVTGSKNVKDSTELVKAENSMTSLIRKVTTVASLNWATDEFNWSDTDKRYGLVQCNTELSKDGCRQCLEAMLERVPQCCGTKVGWVVLCPSCGLKIDDYNFYENQTGSPSPLPNPGGLLLRTVTPMSFRDHVQRDDSLHGDLPIIPLSVIQQATDNFSESSKLGEGGFGPDGTEVAVKRLAEMSGQGSEEFENEVIFIAHLHEDSRLRVIHRDLKASNVLLDDEMNPKISDFGLARRFEKDQCPTKTERVFGTYGYMAPEYAMAGLFSVKSDVFSFGVLVLEIIYGKRNGEFFLSEHRQSLLLYTWKLWCEGKSLELIDPFHQKTYIESEVLKCIHIGLLCVQEDAADRPTMSTVVSMLGSETVDLPKPTQPAFSVGRKPKNEDQSSKNYKDNSVDEETITIVSPR